MLGKQAKRRRSRALLKRTKAALERADQIVANEGWVDLRKRVWEGTIGKKIVPLENIIALRKKHLSYQQIADTLGLHASTVTKRLQQVRLDIERVEDFKKYRADIFAIHQNRILDSITPSVIEKAGLKDRHIAVGILYDKERLERGRSTSNIAYADLVRLREQKEKELKELGE